jgi:hypothetical protein
LDLPLATGKTDSLLAVRNDLLVQLHRLSVNSVVDAADSTTKLSDQLQRVRTELEDASRRLEGFTVDAERFPAASVLLGIAALYSTRFDALRIQDVVWSDVEPQELLRYQLIAMAANLQPQVRRAAYRLQFEPWNIVPVATALEADLANMTQLKTRFDSLRQTNSDTSGVVRSARVDVVRGAFAFVDRLLFEASQVADPQRILPARQIAQGVQGVVLPMLQGDYPGGLLALRQQGEQYFKVLTDKELPAQWTRGITFVAELSGASSPDRVNNALARLANSGGGFDAKRRGDQLRVTLNAYGGVYAGVLPWISGESADDKDAMFAGLYLPVGLTTTFRGRRHVFGRELGTLGLFVQAVDLGALGSWRLENDSTVAQRPEIGIAQVVSPGLFLVLEVAGAPMTIGYGISYAPELREVATPGASSGANDGDAKKQRVGARRMGLFVAFDVPIFP